MVKVNAASSKSLAVVAHETWVCCISASSSGLKMSDSAEARIPTCFSKCKYSKYFTFLSKVDENIHVKCNLCPGEKKRSGCAGAVLGTGDPGSRPGRHFFMTRGGRHDHLKKKIIIIWAAKRFSIIYHITVWGIGKLAPPAAAGAPAC